MKTQPPTQGVIYCAVDLWSYVESAVISAFALRQVSPKLPIIILSNLKNTELQEQLYEFNIVIKPILIPEKEKQGNVMISRWMKTRLHTFTEFDETLYLDADILPVKPIDEIWSFLQFANTALTIDPYPTISLLISKFTHVSQVERTYTSKICDGDAVQFNGGLILWRNNYDGNTLFETWHKEWSRFKQQDQLALSRAIQETKTKIADIPSTYNYPIPYLLNRLNISQIEEIEQLNKLKPDLPKLRDIKLIHCYQSITLYSNIFKEVAIRLMPDATEKALRCLKSIKK